MTATTTAASTPTSSEETPDLVRDEPALVAQVLWLLRQRGRVFQDREWLDTVLADIGIDIDDMAAAIRLLGERPWERFVEPRRCVYAPRTADAPPTTHPDTNEPRMPAGTSQGRGRHGPRTSLPEPSPPLKRPATRQRQERGNSLFCPRHNDGAGAWLSKLQFALRADRPGQYKSSCMECTARYSQAKYLSAATIEALRGEGVRVSDLSAEARRVLTCGPCTLCSEAFAGDDVVVAIDTPVIVHKACP